MKVEEVRKLASLARLSLRDEEVAALQKQLGDIVGYVDQLKEVDIDGVEPMTHAVPAVLPRREDTPIDVLGRKAVEGSAGYEDGLVKVPKIVE